MQSVMNVILNRARERHTSPYFEAVRPWQFSSMTAVGDPELVRWPEPNDHAWEEAQSLAQLAGLGNLADLTGGAISYYAVSLKQPPAWIHNMTFTVEIAGQRFYCALQQV